MSPDSGWRGSPPCAQCGSRSGSRARRLCEPSERDRGARRAQESSVPASPRRWRTSSLSALATPPPPLWPPPLRARGSAYSRCPAPPTHPGLAAVTPLPARRVGAPLAPAALERDIRYKVIIIEKTRKDGHGTGQLSARKAEVSADSRSVLPPSPHSCSLNR